MTRTAAVGVAMLRSASRRQPARLQLARPRTMSTAEAPDVRIKRLQREVAERYLEGRLADALAAAKECREACEAEFKVHPSVASAYNNEALMEKALGNMDRARTLYRQALEVYGKCFGEAHPSYATALHNLAQAERAAGAKEEATVMLQRALEIRRSTLGPNHADVAASLSALASAFREARKFDVAVAHHREALLILRRRHGEEHPATATAMNNMALTLKEKGDFAQARHLYERAATMRLRCLGRQHPDYFIALHNLAELHRASGDTESAHRVDAVMVQLVAEREKALATEAQSAPRGDDGAPPDGRDTPAAP
jgi:tetratricopeptide (TPR) repeat protein